jgi:hypothetical protein
MLEVYHQIDSRCGGLSDKLLDDQSAFLSAPKLARVVHGFLAVGTLQALGMKMLEYPVNATVVIK